MTALVGMELSGRYRLDAQIGSGGMSTVYRAFDGVLERRVAVKLMHREIASDSDQLERFRREARAVARLSHAHVVGVIDAGEDDGRPYIVFEYVEGETLKDRIRRAGRLPIPEAIAYAIEIARALGAAHAVQIVHRDIKPQNVLIDEEGSAKVTDFGIARSLADEGLTADGRVLGTTDYVSPEQALGRPVTGQSDIYSLGIVLYEMLTGEVPFHGENQVAVAMKHVREDLPDVQVRRPEVSASLAAVLDKMTSKDLARRHPDAAALQHDLEAALAIEAARSGQTTGEATAVLRTLPSDQRRLLPLRMRLHPSVFVLLALAVLAAGAAFLLVREGSERVERGTGATREPAPSNTDPVSVPKSSASDFDPFGDGAEHSDRAQLVIDRDTGTYWTTESYDGATFASKTGCGEDVGAPPCGVGIYLDARPRVAASEVRLQTNEEGWEVEFHVAESGPPEDLADWTKVGSGEVTRRSQTFELDTAGQAYRYYLVWITSLPPSERVQLSEVELFTPRG
jgi:eukaryotic-like serine/threonine-protein kinase